MRILGIQFRIEEGDFTKEGFENHVESFYNKTDPGDIIVFPEDIGLLTAFRDIKAKDVTGAMQEIYSMEKERVDYYLNRGKEFVKALFLSIEERSLVEFYEFFSSLSREYSVYTITCNNMGENEGVYNTCFVFDTYGKEIFRQRKVHLTEMEISLSLDPGKLEDVRSFKIYDRKFGIAISLDAFCPDYLFMIRDAEFFIQPDANPGKWNSYIGNGRWQPEDWMDSSYYVAQRLPYVRYAINPMMVGNILDINFEGQSAIMKKAEKEDLPMAYIGNIPTVGFKEIIGIEDYRPTEYYDRKDVENRNLIYPEGVLEVELQ
jgi:predicted amidohydrolase